MSRLQTRKRDVREPVTNSLRQAISRSLNGRNLPFLWCVSLSGCLSPPLPRLNPRTFGSNLLLTPSCTAVCVISWILRCCAAAFAAAGLLFLCGGYVLSRFSRSFQADALSGATARKFRQHGMNQPRAMRAAACFLPDGREPRPGYVPFRSSKTNNKQE
jgi:hypothetical protein